MTVQRITISNRFRSPMRMQESNDLLVKGVKVRVVFSRLPAPPKRNANFSINLPRLLGVPVTMQGVLPSNQQPQCPEQWFTRRPDLSRWRVRLLWMRRQGSSMRPLERFSGSLPSRSASVLEISRGTCKKPLQQVLCLDIRQKGPEG